MKVRSLALVGLVALAACGRSDDQAESALLRALRSGGFVLYMRHAAAVPDRKDGPQGPFEDCSWQRTLTDAGRSEAREMGPAIAALKLPIESVIASPMCRTMDTATLAFGRATPEPALRGGGLRPDGKIDVSPITKFFSKAPSPGRVAAIVGHESPGLGFQPMLEEGETAVIRPKANSYDVIGRIPPGQWQKWAHSKTAPSQHIR
jgi:phosphohistidine phosphatase SixA